MESIDTDEQLNGYPPNTVILDADEWAWQKDVNQGSHLWIPAAFYSELLVDDGGRPSLPARLLYVPHANSANES
ncbi:hypothetical protein PBI_BUZZLYSEYEAR_45 [Mycobacterium phage BuzzLyseyear]|uniref:Uncharacterized protein n=2 Tax=Cheoctovirus TaxID=1623281 RepID=A0A088FQT8_9CAUD|nr:hypothetical protein PBI_BUZZLYSEYEAR_45 [Mycobacterium phage BuzzLyseyear]YP_009962496.1 hypothetical protein I5H90_gp043 [Mycobacterium phage Spikelee]AIM50167.1 hypothetical protein PBI_BUZZLYSEYEAR_45 [Mycobacterium phage BuzzLyseyear]AXQ62172.1 hypothetical protein SEA_SPIKELEE_43 [Mycobacterium phage Spikelee]